MVRQRDGAVLALEFFSAGAAHDGKGVAAPVEQNQRLLAALERRLGLLDERSRKELVLARLLEFAAHVDELDLGQRTVHHAVAQLDARVLAALRILPAFKRGRGRAHDHDCAGQLGAHDGHVARVVARRLFLLVALVVLLVDENQSQIWRGRKDCRARANDDGRIAAANATPLLAALFRRERGVQQGYFLPESLIEQTGHLRGEADFGNEQDRGEAAVECLLHGGKIDGGFSGAGDAVEQERMERPDRAGDRCRAHRPAPRSG